MHGVDVVHSGRLGADEVDGVFESLDDVEGTVDGADEGFDVGRTEGAEEDEGIGVGYDDVDGSTVGHPSPKMVDYSDPKSPPPSRMTSLS